MNINKRSYSIFQNSPTLRSEEKRTSRLEELFQGIEFSLDEKDTKKTQEPKIISRKKEKTNSTFDNKMNGIKNDLDGFLNTDHAAMRAISLAKAYRKKDKLLTNIDQDSKLAKKIAKLVREILIYFDYLEDKIRVDQSFQ